MNLTIRKTKNYLGEQIRRKAIDLLRVTRYVAIEGCKEGSTMTNPEDNAAASSRTAVRIRMSSGDELEAWPFLPEGAGPHPAVVMAHGIGAIKAGGLEFLHRHAKTPSRI